MIDGRRVAAVICLHYGACYLPYAMRSVADVVDSFLIMYAPTPNHGTFSASLPNPDTRDMLWDAAHAVDGDIRWFDFDGWRSEGEQFKFGMDTANADVTVKLDADEIWVPHLLQDAVRYGLQQQVREIRLPLRHYWRSFYKAFTHDPAAPGRVYLSEFSTGETTFATSDERYRIQHYGYAMPVDVMRYKMSIHGHKAEFVNPNWFDEVYATNRQHNCHPCGHSYWMMPDDVTPPECVMDHPFAQLRVIE